MVTFRTIGEPLAGLGRWGNGERADLWITETLDPERPYIDVMAGDCWDEDDAILETGTMQVHESKDLGASLLCCANVQISADSRNRVNPAVWHLLMHKDEIFAGEGDDTVKAWQPYQVRAYLHQYIIRYYNSVLDGTADIQISAKGTLLVESGDRCLKMRRYTAEATGAPVLQMEFADNGYHNCKFLSVTEENGKLVISRTYKNIPYAESTIASRVLGRYYNHHIEPI